MADTTSSEQPSVEPAKEYSRPSARTPAQLEALQRARAKAAEVRAKNTELRRKERELVSAQLEESRRLREESIRREHAQRFASEGVDEQADPAEEEEVVYQHKPKRKRRVVVVQDSSEEEIEVKLPRQKKHSAESADDELYRRTYQRMFELL